MAMGRLRRDKTIIILPVDKGNSTVVMDREDYDNRIDLVLSEGAYAKIPRDPTKNVEKMIRDNLQKLLRNKEMTRDFHIQMHHSSTVYQKCTRQTFPCDQLSTLGDHLLITWPNIWLESLHR